MHSDRFVSKLHIRSKWQNKPVAQDDINNLQEGWMRTNIFPWKAAKRESFCSLGFTDRREDILSSVKTLVKESFDSSLKKWTTIVGDADDLHSSFIKLCRLERRHFLPL